MKPNYLDYANTQILLIGEDVDKAMEPTTKDKKHGKEAPKEELDELEHEDELRVQHLQGESMNFAKEIIANPARGRLGIRRSQNQQERVS